jgi:hypothetical protein
LPRILYLNTLRDRIADNLTNAGHYPHDIGAHFLVGIGDRRHFLGERRDHGHGRRPAGILKCFGVIHGELAGYPGYLVGHLCGAGHIQSIGAQALEDRHQIGLMPPAEGYEEHH